MNPTTLGGIGPGFLNQVPTLKGLQFRTKESVAARACKLCPQLPPSSSNDQGSDRAPRPDISR